MRNLLKLGAALFAAIALVPALAVEPPSFRLPAGARPTHYSVTLTVVPGEAKAAGEITIDVELDRPHDVLWLNADSITVTTPRTEIADTRSTILAGFEQFVGVAFEPPLPAGRHRLTLAFEAAQSRNSTRGIFTQQDGDAWYTMTQFESISARRAFPCFDEPGFKTPWDLTLRVPAGLVAVANTKITSQTTDADGLATVRFATTRPLPSYLVAFAVGPWEFVDLGKNGSGATPTRIIVPRGRKADTSFAATAYPQLFKELESWFAIPYPFDKLDHVAIPLSVNFAMENAGFITYGSSILLAKPGDDTARFRRTSASVGAHEISHQWFGDLVTTAWWDDIWLNEAFATWMAEKIVQQWRPDYEHGAARIEERSEAIDEDTLTSARRIREPVNSRGDIFRAFDNITYRKGATVIGMFEGWIGEATFRGGVRSYIEARRDGSATAEDFLAALEKASGKPVTPAFNTFLNQNGVPKLDVRLQCDAGGAKALLAQHRLVPLGSSAAEPRQWQIPVCLRYGSGSTLREACTLMADVSVTVPLAGACPAFVFANAGGRGYYVPDYGDDLLSKLAANRDALTAAEFESVLLDLKALLRGGAVTSAQVVQWIRLGAAAHDRHVVQAAAELAEFTGTTLVDENERPRYAEFIRQVFGPRAKTLGFAPKAGESDDDQLLRRAILRVAAPEDPALAKEARRLSLAWLENRRSVDPGLVDVVLIAGARTGDATLLDAMYAEAKTTQDRSDRRNLMVALFEFTDPALAKKGMGVLLDPAFDNRESWAALYRAHKEQPARRATYDYIVANYDALAKTVAPESPGGWPGFAEGLCSEKDATDVTAFWKPREKDLPSAGAALAEAVESIRACAAVRAKTRELAM